MATRIRLQRFGKKNQAFYHLVIADGRAPRDGRFIEQIGTYNPLTHPATVNINFDRALYWVEAGASPSDTARSILKHEGIYLMKHLRGGIAKGAITQLDADRKFDAWKQEKDSKLGNLKREISEKQRTELKKRLDAETKVKEATSAKVAAKYAKEAAAEAAATEETIVEEVAEVSENPAEVVDEIPSTEEPAAEVTETPAE